MRKLCPKLILCFLLLLPLIVPQPAFAATGINKQINFQGKVVNANGTNVANGNYDFVFSIYTVASAGTAVWTETRTVANQVTVTDGIFRVSLGSITALPGSIDFNTDNIYLGINFNNDGEMTPRIQFAAVPQAFNALKVAGLTVTDTTGTFTLAAAKTLTVNNTLTFAGTDSTSFTFPSTSGGTVITSNAPSQTVTSTQTSGTVLGISDSTAVTAAIVGQSITLSGTGAFDQTGVQFSLSGASGTNLNDILGTSSTWKVSRAGVATFASGTVLGSQTFTTNNIADTGALTIKSGGTSGLTFDSASGDISVSANDGLTFAATTLGNNGSKNVAINSGTGGTTATLIVKLDTSGTVVTTDTTTLNNAVGVALNTTTAGGAVRVAINGVVTATADNTVAAGDYIGLGTTTAGRAKSLGTTYPSTSGVQVIGRALGGATAGSTFLLMLNGLDNNVAAGGGGGYNLIKDETTSLTARTTLAFLGTGVTCADNAGLTQTECTMSGAGGGVSFASGTPDNTATSNNLIHLQKSGVNRFVVANSGGLTISSATSDIVKTTTGTTLATDFSLTGSTLTNVTSSNDLISIDSGAVTNTMSTSTVVTTAVAGAGAHAIMRDDNQYIIIHGNSSATASRWDGSSATMTSVTVATGAVLPGAGAISLKRPDGRYLLIHGNASAGLTSIFDPWNITAAVAGPAVCGGGAATTGTNAFLRDDGVYVILCGNLTAWGTYNPTSNVYTAGTAVAVAFGAGAHAIRRDDGTFLIFRGANTTTHWIYNPYASATGTMTQDPITANAPTINTGSFSIRRTDGKYLVMGGAVNTSTIYDPTRTSANSGAGTMTAQSGAGFGPTAALGDGAQAIWRQDGKYLIITGNTTTTNIIDPSKSDLNQFVAGPALNAAAASGIHGIMRADGAMQIIRGGATTTTDVYNTGFIIGGAGSGTQLASYETECITATSLNATSTLKWNKNAEGKIWFQVKTGNGACSGSYKDILNSGDLINPTVGDNRIQIKAFFQRDFPKFADQEWGLRRGLGQVRYRRTNKDPALYDIQVDNSTAFHRNQFEFGNSTDPSGPIFVNLSNDRNRELAIALEYGVGYGSTILNTANLGIAYAGAFGEHPALTTGITGHGTVVMRKPDGKYIIIAGTAAANAMEYDATTQTITAQAGAGNIPTATTGKGAAAFKRPDGKFLIIMGGNTTTTNIYDPLAASGSRFVAGPATTAAVDRGSSLIPLPNGRLLIIHGNNLNTTTIYDPFQNTMVAGPLTSAAVGHGSLAIPRPDGTYFVPLGNPAAAGTCATTNTVTNHFNPYTMIFTNNTEAMSATPGEGAFAIQRTDGMWWIFHGNGGSTTCTLAATTTLYNPFTNQAVAGPATTNVTTPVNLGGQHAIPRPDGSWLFVHGAGLSTTSICKEKVGATGADSGVPIGICIAGPSIGPVNPGTALTVNSGATSFQRDDGKHVMFLGNVTSQTTTVRLYDGGWVGNGTYRSEALNIADLDSNSALVWQSNSANGNISAEVRTATSKENLQVATTREIPTSGGLINPQASETWLQVSFNFRRSFPSYPSIRSDVWSNNTNGIYEIRKIDKPILHEFKVTKDVDLVNLKTDGLSVFRVSSAGDIYTSSAGSINTGGADLAENYTSAVTLEKGEVVTIDPQNNHGVMRSKYQYQPDVLGVVSTDPGFVAGSYTKDSYPIALVGRVPVKVSTENGLIRVGDYITASSVPGYAMKATYAGRVLGKALETIDTAKLIECPPSDFQIPGRRCGTVMVFVNLTDYLGAPVEIVMAENRLSGLSSQLSDNGQSVLGLSVTDQQGQILAFLKQIKEEQASQSAGYRSEVFTDRITAQEIIGLTVFADTLHAKKIQADSIEGLEILTDKISGLSSQVAGVASPSARLSTSEVLVSGGSSDGVVKFDKIEFESAKVNLDLIILGRLETQGGLIVSGPAQFNNDTVFASLVSFISKVIFKGNVFFEGVPTFSADTAGLAVIKKDADQVEVTFEKEYAATPIVSANITFDPVRLADGSSEDPKILQKRVAESNYSYFIVNRTKKSFTIILNKNASQDLTFSWTALSVKDARRFESKVESKSEPTPTPSIVPTSASPISSPNPSTATPVATSSAGLTP